MSNAEGNKLAKMLKKLGWDVMFSNATCEWRATHPDAVTVNDKDEPVPVVLHWAKSVRVQRVLDQAASALGLPPPSGTSHGAQRKERQARERQRVHKQQMDQEQARDKAFADLLVIAETERPDSALVNKKVRARFDDLSLSSTYSAVRKAQQQGITGRSLQAALVHPVGVFEGYNGCVKYVGTDCTVIVSELGYIVGVNKIN